LSTPAYYRGNRLPWGQGKEKSEGRRFWGINISPIKTIVTQVFCCRAQRPKGGWGGGGFIAGESRSGEFKREPLRPCRGFYEVDRAGRREDRRVKKYVNIILSTQHVGIAGRSFAPSEVEGGYSYEGLQAGFREEEYHLREGLFRKSLKTKEEELK